MATMPGRSFQTVLSAADFERITQVRAYLKWSTRERGRRGRNWSEALRELGWDRVYRDDSRYPTVEAKAEEVYTRYKDRDAREDWTDTERELLAQYRVR